MGSPAVVDSVLPGGGLHMRVVGAPSPKQAQERRRRDAEFLGRCPHRKSSLDDALQVPHIDAKARPTEALAFC